MKSAALLSAVFLASFAFAGSAIAKRSVTENVLVESSKSVAEMAEYVELVDHRLQKGRYDVVTEKERKWIIQNIARMRKALQAGEVNAAPSAELKELASEFETGMIKIEEGGIVCRQERRTGTRMSTQRCFSRKRLTDDTNKSQDQLRKLNRQPLVPIGQ
jgi:hypothetical protein